MGTSIHQDEATPHLQDHPHACGDKSIDTPATFVVRGSSPRVWGQASHGAWRSRSSLIIPTRMGTSCPCVRAGCARRDHPHAYGDKHAEVNQKFGSKGSSPRVWGQAVRQAQSCHMNRIIPTRMGTRHQWQYERRNKAGSSPRVWGQVLDKSKHRSLVRIIPTRMGTRLSERLRCEGFGDHPHAYGDKS